MENQENNQETPQVVETPKQELIITTEIKEYLLETVKWGKFLAISGYIIVGLLLILSLLFIFGMGMFGSLYGNGMGVMIGGLYFIMCVLYLFPIHYLYKFSIEVKKGLQSSENNFSLVTGFENLKSLFKFMGVMTAVVLSFYALVIVVAFIGGLITAIIGGM